MFRDGEGRFRNDFGNMSTIIDPKTRETILLDHIAKEARKIPSPKIPAMPQMPVPPGGLPGAPAMGSPMQVIDLGKKIIEGHEAEGKQFLFSQLPKLPNAPAIPGAPALPGAPAMPAMPQPIQMMETWTTTHTQIPVLTKITGGFGEQICKCGNIITGEPKAELFKIPPDYKLVDPKAPPMPQAPAVPKAPALPQAPKLPKFPS